MPIFLLLFLFYPKVGAKIEHKLFFLKLFGRPRDTPVKSRDIPPKSLVSLGFEGHAGLFGPIPSRGRPPPHRKISGPKSLGLGSFFLPDKKDISIPTKRANQTQESRLLNFLSPKRFKSLGCKGFISHRTPRLHPRIRLALPSSGVDLASK